MCRGRGWGWGDVVNANGAVPKFPSAVVRMKWQSRWLIYKRKSFPFRSFSPLLPQKDGLRQIADHQTNRPYRETNLSPAIWAVVPATKGPPGVRATAAPKILLPSIHTNTM